MTAPKSSKWSKISPYVFLIVIVFVTQAMEYYGLLASANGKVLDFFLTREVGNSKGPRVVTIEIDDNAYQSCFQYSPMHPQQVGRLVSLVQQAGAPVIGVDIFTDAPENRKDYQQMANDEMSAYGSTIIWAADSKPSALIYSPWLGAWLVGKEDKIIAYPREVLGFNPLSIRKPPPVLWALPVFPRDEDAVVRRLPLKVTIAQDGDDPEAGEERRIFARVVADRYCAFLHTIGETCPARSGNELLVPYGRLGRESFSAGNFAEFFHCSGPPTRGKPDTTICYSRGGEEKLRSRVKDRAVIIGGTFGSSDIHESPIGPIAGVRINAYAVEAQLGGGEFYAVEQPWAWLLDLTLGLIFLSLEPVSERLAKSKHIPGWLPERDLVLFAGFVVVGCIVLFLFGSLWALPILRYMPGFVTIGIGVFVHQFFHAHHVARERHAGTKPKRTPHSSHPAQHRE